MSRLLVGIPNAERKAAEAALAGCPTVALREGVSRAAARVPACALLVVEEGLVEVASHRAGATRRMVVAVAGPGAVLLRPERDERLEALGDAWLTAVSHEALSALLQLPGAAAALLEALAEAARERQESLASFSSVRHVERVRDKLLQLARAHGRVVSGGVRLDVPLTHERLGEMIGSARETVTWAVAELQREGFLERNGRVYRLLVAPEALAS
jgi:CRP-like cAMP-binding protein